MVIGVLQIELRIPEPDSLKDKRRVVQSVKDRLHREHMVSVAEIDAHDKMTTAVLGIALVANDGKHAGVVLDRITDKLRGLHDAELVATQRDIISGEPAERRS